MSVNPRRQDKLSPALFGILIFAGMSILLCAEDIRLIQKVNRLESINAELERQNQTMKETLARQRLAD
jgi:hypothetical protein